MRIWRLKRGMSIDFFLKNCKAHGTGDERLTKLFQVLAQLGVRLGKSFHQARIGEISNIAIRQSNIAPNGVTLNVAGKSRFGQKNNAEYLLLANNEKGGCEC